MDWQECCKKRTTKKVSPDFDLINSLTKTSENKLKSEKQLELNEVTAASKTFFSL